MVTLEAVRAANAALVRTKPFVAVVAGGTSGIGEYTVRELAKLFGDKGDGLRIYIVGRNQAAAEDIIAGCERVCPAGRFRFLGGDLALLREVDRVCAEITKTEQEIAKVGGQVAKIDVLVLSQGLLSFSGRIDTEEGLDKHMSLFYYSRVRFAVQLLPLLRESPMSGHVILVGNPKLGSTFFAEDLSLRAPGRFGFRLMISHGVYMCNLFMEHLAQRNPGKLSLSHCYPGSVKSKAASRGALPWIVEFLFNWVIEPLRRPWSVPNDECGQRMLFMASTRFPARLIGGVPVAPEGASGLEVAAGGDDVVGSGFYFVDQDGSTCSQDEQYRKLREEGFGDRVWQHTMEAFEEIEAGRVFKG